jgi:hypothetical protein
VAGNGTLLLDGEVVAFSGGRPEFASLQRRMTTGTPRAHLAAGVIEVPPAFPGDAALLEASLAQGYEGIVLICSAEDDAWS